ncbi:hypothetical protein [Deinococcus apachensis]|uniref:hypothetical protein n=1 Tax=Deinococcus apachensis TaxID=309886 RepID=UPI00035C1528|nr:hypothetical protein [Deinococcus apachensis]
MTAPALTDEQLQTLRVFVTAAAWTYHEEELSDTERVNSAVTFAVYQDLRLVAADILDAAALHASKQAAGGSGGVKRLKIEGELEVEKFAQTSTSTVDASTWAALAERLRGQVSWAGRSGLVPSPLAGLRTGSSGGPTFTVTRRGDP